MSKFGPPTQPCSGCGKEFTVYDDKYHVVMQKDIVNRHYKLKSKATLHHLYFCKNCAEEFYDFMCTYSNNDGKAFWM